MNNRSVLQLSPEDEELQRKSAELDVLEADLVQGELDLATLHAELQNLDREYQQVIGTRYIEIERIEQQIAEYMAYLESDSDFNPSEDLKKLYREVAKRSHPNLTTDAAEKIERQKMMMEANQAYEDGDIEKLRAILHGWESTPKSFQVQGVGAELVRVIRKIAQCRERSCRIQQEMAAVKQTELYELLSEVNIAQENGKNLLTEMAECLDEQISQLQQNLKEIKDKIGTS